MRAPRALKKLASLSFITAETRLRSAISITPCSKTSAWLSTYEYDAYGAPNAWGTGGSTARFCYTGQAAIPEAQLYYYKARVYDPVFGRFLQTDPVGYGPDVNWYAYVGNDPVNKAHPSGMVGPSGIGPGIDPETAQEAMADVGDLVANVAEVAGYGAPEGPGFAGPVDEVVNALRGAADVARTGAAEARAAQFAKNIAQGAKGEAKTAAKYGDKISGRQVTFKTSTGAKTRADFVTKSKGAVETKTGRAQLNKVQRQLNSDIEAGRQVTPVGQNARDAGLTPGQPTRMNSCSVDRRPC